MKNNKQKKKIVNCFYEGCISGFGDFLRGSIHLYERCNSHGLDFDIDTKNHPISEFISTKHEGVVDKSEIDCIPSEVLKESNMHFYKRVNDFVYNKLCKANGVDYIFSNFAYFLNVSQEHMINVVNMLPELSDDCKKWFQENIKFSDEIESIVQDKLKDLGLEPKKFDVIHFRLGDEVSFREGIRPDYWVPDEDLCFKICDKILQGKDSDFPVVLMSDCNEVKEYIEEKASELNLPIHVLHLKSGHMQKQTDANKKYISDIEYSRENLLHTVLDMRLISLADTVRSFSVYPWGSGFVTWICKIYGVDFKVERLKQIKNN
jgi:hypothetical protein